MRVPIVLSIVASLALAIGFALSVALGGPRTPAPMSSITSPFRGMDFSGLPPLSRFRARDGAALAYRLYPSARAPPAGSAVLVHGSSAASASLHPLAAALARAGFTAFALELRGHGDSGVKGRIAYVGQLEDDLEDFISAVAPPNPRVLVGFSSGGGFALRFAGSERQKLFNGYLLLSPFLHQDADTARPQSGGWAAVGVPRIAALGILNRFGISAFNELPVVAFALGEEERKYLTPSYSYALAVNFRPHDDYRGDMRAARQPMEVLVGQEDEAFRAERFAGVFAKAGRPTPVTVVPGLGHVGLTVQPAGIEAVVSAVRRLSSRGKAAGAPPP